MSQTESTPAAVEKIEKEADHHPYFRPKDAATLILIDRSAAVPKVLVGKRHDNVVFMPGKFVFPGGRVDKTDNRIPVAAPIPPQLEANLLQGSPKISVSRARALAVTAIREACEETGLCLGCKPAGKAPTLDGPWAPFTEAGLLPDPSSLYLIARAITPPGRIKRFDTRFFTADASAIAHRVEGVIHPEAELVELVWVEIGSKPLADLHPMTTKVLQQLEKRLATGPLRHDAPVPFFHFFGGKMQMELLAGTA
ncbi:MULTISPECIES: NUDIX hydrolase [Rhodopseudomonas]|uniref:NUDIX hydrolase n=1 Tax=Rhodopseudomonas palustris TaxID=1076 RepID=A0A0D7DY49_RHOPL|nr:MULTISPECIES: NUDIX hydrolase [Rhodopseudomonas]KIZ33479.1 NUDIX hydrolase [Rhodopseudomonas palustris]MDF3809516.1 NUDIX hydrolase [Rhodopseudomonas sp. BAL398]WOK19344.1 NUDIX hydrolase [Rhodopseudomonas sp. BAL398]